MKKLLLLLFTIPALSQVQPPTEKRLIEMYYTDKSQKQQISNLIKAADSCVVIVESQDKRLKEVIADNEKTASELRGLYDELGKLQVDNAVLKEKKPKPWGIGIQAGATYDGKTKPYIGAGVSYNLIRF